MSEEPTRILCVDDHAFVVAGLTARLEFEPDLRVVGWLDRADDLVREVRRSGAQIVVLDIDMPGADTFEALAELSEQCPQVRTILLSAYVRDHYIDRAFEAGAWGYLSKSDSPDAVVAGIRSVMHGEPCFGAGVACRSHPHDRHAVGRHATTRSKLSLLTARERQILRMIARGMSRTAIAQELNRSPNTVDNHRKSIMRKLGISDRTELVRYAIAEGLVEV